MKLKFTIILEEKVTPETLKLYYEADSLEEAAKNQQAWINDRSYDVIELVTNAEHLQVIVEGIES